jgi:hypothetical protein
MINRDVDRKKWSLSILSVASALILGGCAQPSGSTSGYGAGTSPGGYSSPDPYHYRCTGYCQGGA